MRPSRQYMMATRTMKAGAHSVATAKSRTMPMAATTYMSRRQERASSRTWLCLNRLG